MRAGLVSLFGLLLVLPVAAQDNEDAISEQDFDRNPVRCVSINRIRRTRAIDDQTILFYMRGREIYQNILPRDCPRLKSTNRFMYETVGSRLCSSDTIDVLEQFSSRLDSIWTCRLGEFHPVTDFEAEEMLLISEERPRAGAPIKIEPVELPPEGEAESEAEVN